MLCPVSIAPFKDHLSVEDGSVQDKPFKSDFAWYRKVTPQCQAGDTHRPWPTSRDAQAM